MTKAVTYVEADLDRCSREYGDGFSGVSGGGCFANLGAGWPTMSPAVGKDFGAAGYFTRGGALTGIADSLKVTVAGSLRATGGDGTNRHILMGTTTIGGTTGRLEVNLDSINRLTVRARNAAGADILEVVTSVGAVLTDGPWVHFAFSADLADVNKRHFIVNAVEAAAAWFDYDGGSGDIDFTGCADWAVGGRPNGTLLWDGIIGRLWFEPGLYLDLSDPDVLALFFKTFDEPVPVYYGPSGEFITGSPPILFLANADWEVNLGTGGNFALTGTLGDDVPFATGPRKCFNTLATCQDRENFDNDPVTLRFARDAAYLPRGIEAVENLEDVAFTPPRVSLGEDLGQRAVVRAVFRDHRWPDTADGFDKYHAERGYDPAKQGTFWGKFRARHPFAGGRAFRLIRGAEGDALAAMETRHYYIDSFDGPDTDARYKLVATDILKLADNDKAQAPAPNNGALSSAIDSDDTMVSLSPAGIGDAEYTASGHVAIGGTEICAFTRSGDDLTLTRAQLGTPAEDHSEGDRVQLVLRYSGADAADIIHDLLTNYAGIDGGTGGVIELANWQAETAAHLGVLFTADIPEPTGVNQLVSELIEQAALALWWDDMARQIRLRVIRPVDPGAALFDEENIPRGSLTIAEQPEKRLSQVWTYYGRRNPLKPIAEIENYASLHVSVDLQREADYGAPAVRKILARWIPAFGAAIAERLSDLQLARFGDPPRRFRFALDRASGETIGLGDACRIGGWPLQDATGAAVTVPAQVTSLSPEAARLEVEAEEMRLTAIAAADLTDRVITIDTDFNDFNLRTVHDNLFPPVTAQDLAGTGGVNLTCIVAEGAIVGATQAGTDGHAFEIGDWPTGMPIKIVVRGRIQGKGGQGGNGGFGTLLNETLPTAGETGGTALHTRFPIDLELHATGEIWGGAGGGPGARMRFFNPGGGGGAGQGQTPSPGGTAVSPAQPGAASTPEAPGQGGAGTNNNKGGDGGAPGEAGKDAFGNAAPGSAGPAIDGVSFLTVTLNDGDRQGPEVN